MKAKSWYLGGHLEHLDLAAGPHLAADQPVESGQADVLHLSVVVTIMAMVKRYEHYVILQRF